MKAIVIPHPIRVPRSLVAAGTITVPGFIREIVLVRPAWRRADNRRLLLEITEQLWTLGPEGEPLDKRPGVEARWQDAAHELLVREAALEDDGYGRPLNLRWELATVVAEVQEVLAAATTPRVERTNGAPLDPIEIGAEE
jgi:hypothetical protein